MKAWILDRLVALDIWINRLFNGDPQETITIRAAHSERYWGRILCWFLDLLDRGHCRRYYDPDRWGGK